MDINNDLDYEWDIELKKADLHPNYLIKQHPDNLALMQILKKSIDPNNIMNPGKVIDL